MSSANRLVLDTIAHTCIINVWGYTEILLHDLLLLLLSIPPLTWVSRPFLYLLMLLFLFCPGAAWPITLGLGIGIGAGYSNCRHQFVWHGPHGPPFHFGRPPWAGGGRPYWWGTGKDGREHPPCHQEWKVG